MSTQSHHFACPLCRPLEEGIPAYSLFEDGKLALRLSVRPVQPGHLLLIPKDHNSTLFELSNYRSLSSFMYGVSRCLRAAMKSDRIGVATDCNEEGHTFIHLIPINSARDFHPTSKIEMSFDQLASLYLRLQDTLAPILST